MRYDAILCKIMRYDVKRIICPSSDALNVNGFSIWPSWGRSAESSSPPPFVLTNAKHARGWGVEHIGKQSRGSNTCAGPRSAFGRPPPPADRTRGVGPNRCGGRSEHPPHSQILFPPLLEKNLRTEPPLNL